MVGGAPARRLVPGDRAAGRLQHVRVNADTIAIQGIPSVLYVGHGGLLDIAVDPEFEQSQLVYLSYLHGEETAA